MALERIGPFEYQRFSPSPPPQGAGKAEENQCPVLIAGGGPVGMAMAVGLARWGIRTVVVEADDSVCEGSRAACISRRSLEIVDRLGVAQAFVEKGLAWTRGRSYYGTEEVLVFDMPSSSDEKFPPMINLQQYYIEQFLLDEIQRINQESPGTIDIRWASRITALSQDGSGVKARVENTLGACDVSAGWLLATDGGQSFVRSSLGLELKGTGYQGRYAIVDIELASEAPTERRAWFDPPWAKGTTILMHRQPDNIWRIDYQLAPGQDADTVLQPEEIQRFVQTHLDAIGEGHLPWKSVWTSIYRAGAMTLDAYRHGRILFAGNSAHAMPIFGVRGLNSGFDDADNLLWKLAAVINGKAGDALLDSYSQERIQAFHVNASYAMRSTEFMSPPNRGFELMREAVLSLAGRHRGITRLVNPRQTHAITYENSALSSDGDEFHGGPQLGEPLWDALVGEREYLTDHLSRTGFTALVFGDWGTGDAFAAVLRNDDGPVLPCKVFALNQGREQFRSSMAPEGLGSLYGARAGSVYLVRPDGHVCGRWHSPSVEVLRTAIAKASRVERTHP